MGLCISRKLLASEVNIAALQERISELENDPSRGDLESRIRSLETQADANQDGIVTRKEMETYMATQLKLREDELIRLNQENQALKEALVKADQRYEQLLDKVQKGDLIQTSTVSNLAIEKQIQKWLDDPNTNFSFIPDRAEMFAYKKMLASLLGGMEKLFEGFSLEFMGHRLRMTMQPLEDSS